MSSGAPGWALSGVSHIAALTVFGTAALITLVCCVCVARAERRSYPMALFVAGGLCIFYEPLADVLGHCMWARQNVIVEMTLFGVDLPLFAQLVHFTYFAGGLVFLLRRLERGVSPRQWWTYYACGVVIAGAAEMGAIAVNWWHYFGANQPLYVLHYPLWWAFANVMAIFVMAAILHGLRARVITTNARAWLYMLLVPLSFTALHAGVSLPVYAALNSSSSIAVTTMAALATIALSLLLMWITTEAVCVRPIVAGEAGKRAAVVKTESVATAV